MQDIFNNCEGFQWDKGNSLKNWIKHSVLDSECEQVFFSKPLIIGDDKKHTDKEKRWYLLGQTNTGRLLFIAFTIRKNLIRVISARDMSKQERKIYNEKIKEDPEV